MAKRIENECVGCDLPYCMGNSCKYTNVVRYYCDRCDDEFEPEELYVNDDGEELCTECFLSDYETVKERENV